jgi:hypothetical protein
MDRLMRASAYAVGSESFVHAVEERMRGLRTGAPEDHDLSLPREAGQTLVAVDGAVAGHFDIAPESLREHGNRCGPAKAVAVELAARTTGLTLRRIGEHYGLTSGGLCVLRHRLEGNAEALQAVKELVERMEKDE